MTGELPIQQVARAILCSPFAGPTRHWCGTTGEVNFKRLSQELPPLYPIFCLTHA